MTRTFLRAALAGAAALALVVPAADALPLPSSAPAGWLGTAADPVALVAALDAHPEKVPAEFGERLQYALPDGTLRVMVVVPVRDHATETMVAGATTWLHWFGDSRSAYARVTPDQLTTLLNATRVSFVEPDYRIHLTLAVSAPDVHARATATAPGLWSHDSGAPSFGSLTSAYDGLTADQVTGKGVTVAIVDGGIDGTHRDFGGWSCTGEPYQPCESRIKEEATLEPVAGSMIEPSDEATNDFAGGHGTHVAGIVAGNGYASRTSTFETDPETYGNDGRPIGIAPQASLVSVKNGELIWAGLGVYGLQWVKANAQRLGIRVANNSWGCVGGCSYAPNSAEAIAQRDLYRAGVLVVFAAGNDGGTSTGTAFSGDSQSPFVLSVANYDAATHLLASSSSRGLGTAPLPSAATWDPEDEAKGTAYRRPDIAAPGQSIWSARNLTGGAAAGVPRQDTGDVDNGDGCCIRAYASMSGTSMAAPHVAGAAADLFSACPSATVLDVMRALLASADATRVRATDNTRVAVPYEVGYGGLDVRAALDWLSTNVAVCRSIDPNLAPVAAITAPERATATEAVGFDAAGSSDADGSIASYAWDFGDGSSASGAQASHAYARSGRYEVRLTVTDDDGATATALTAIDVDNAAPAASAAGPETVTARDAAAFDGSASADRDGTLESYAWDFGDGATAQGAQVTHAWSRSGTYVVTLTVTDDEGATATAARSVTVRNAAPAAAFTAPDTLVHEAQGSFDGSGSADPDGSLASYAWQFGDGTTGTGATASHAWVWAGRYTVTLTVTDDEGATATATRTVTVTDEPASGMRRLQASGLDNHKCDAKAWTLAVTGAAPDSVAIVWSDGTRERVARTGSKGKSTLYATTASLAPVAVSAWTDVPASAATAKLELASGPCH